MIAMMPKFCSGPVRKEHFIHEAKNNFLRIFAGDDLGLCFFSDLCSGKSIDVVDIRVIFPLRLRLRLRGNQPRTFRCGHHGETVVKKVADIAEIVRVVFVFSVLFVRVQKITLQIRCRKP